MLVTNYDELLEVFNIGNFSTFRVDFSYNKNIHFSCLIENVEEFKSFVTTVLLEKSWDIYKLCLEKSTAGLETVLYLVSTHGGGLKDET